MFKTLFTLGVVMTLAAETVSQGASAETPVPKPYRVYVGTYTGGESRGIYLLEYGRDGSSLANRGVAAEVDNPAFLALHPSKPVLYAVGEASDGGTVHAFRIDNETGLLRAINEVPSVGSGPCHVDVAPGGKHVAVANYGGGSVALFPVGEDGSLGEACAFVQHGGHGPVAKRQEGPHAHGVYFSRNNDFLFVPDLGADKVFVYAYDSEAGTLTPHPTAPFVASTPGDGPRHMAFNSLGLHAFVVNELSNTISVLRYEVGNGTFEKGQDYPTLPADFSGQNTTAEIHVHPTLPYLYASNRGHDSIAAFAIDRLSGELTPLGQTPSGGKTPRYFAVHPNGHQVLVAHQDSGNVVVFDVDSETGTLSPSGIDIAVPKPVCLLFVQPR